MNINKPSLNPTPRMIPDTPQKTIPVNDINIAYREFGSGKPLLMIMGYAGTMEMWDPLLIAALAQEYKVIIFDNRGAGNTTTGTKPFTIESAAEDTHAFLQTLNINRTHILGFSMGSYIALELTKKYPQTLQSLILYATAPGGENTVLPAEKVLKELVYLSTPAEDRDARMIALIFPPDWLAENPDIYGRLPEVRTTVPPETTTAQIIAMQNWKGVYQDLPTIKTPTLIITGTDDILTPPDNSKIIAEQLPNSTIVQFPKGGHGLMYQFPKKLADTVRQFLGKSS